MYEISLPIPPVEPAPAPASPAFAIVHEQLDRKQNGSFRPHAFIKVLPELRTSRLLSELPARELQTLLCLLTFLSPNGEIVPSLPDIAHGLSVSEREARERLEHLIAFSWHGRQIAMRLERDTALPAFSLCPDLITRHEQLPYVEPPEPPIKAASRAEIIARSRALYARPREVVEQQIAEQYQHAAPLSEIPEDEAHAAVRGRLRAVGVVDEQVNILFRHYGLDAITKQLDWLPHRRANTPARYLIAAIQGDYQAPLGFRHQEPPAEVREAALVQTTDPVAPDV